MNDIVHFAKYVGVFLTVLALSILVGWLGGSVLFTPSMHTAIHVGTIFGIFAALGTWACDV